MLTFDISLLMFECLNVDFTEIRRCHGNRDVFPWAPDLDLAVFMCFSVDICLHPQKSADLHENLTKILY